MAAQTDITVKMNDNATNITYSKLVPAGADGQAATWRSETAGAIAAFRPFVALLAKWNAARSVRRLEFEYTYPQTSTDTTTGLTTKVQELKLQAVIFIPASMPQTIIDEGVSQGCNIMADTAIKTAFKSMTAPN